MISGSSILAAVGLAFIALAGLIHVFIFLLESVLWRSRSTWRQFGIASPEDAEVARPWALNQGYYNLFLAIGAIAGGIGGIVSLAAGVSGGYSPLDDPLFSWAGKLNGWGWVAVFTALCMIGAAIVLIASSRGKLLRGALVQGVAPLIGVVLVGFAL